MRGSMTALVLAATAGQAQAQPADLFCAELRRVVAAADDERPFYILEYGRAASPRLGFAHGCGRTGDERRYFWLCTQNLAPESLSAERLAERTRACLPEARPVPASYHRERRFKLPAAEIRISERGGPRAHVGRIVTYVVAAGPGD